jgi:hypothetical protein
MSAALNRNAAGAWSDEAKAIATQARALSGEKLDQLVRRLQRHSGRSRESCWRFVMQTGLKIRGEHRRWTDDEIDTLRDAHSRGNGKDAGTERKGCSLRARTE